MLPNADRQLAIEPADAISLGGLTMSAIDQVIYEKTPKASSHATCLKAIGVLRSPTKEGGGHTDRSPHRGFADEVS